ncbi:MAG: hypothetical protein NXH95_13760 [Pseudomonadaceae bacterium]|nr:hypothetical protein [Pseudomonadaceae bacterium]
MADIARAMIQADAFSSDEFPILWDLRKAQVIANDESYKQGVGDLIRTMTSRMSSQKRAFLVDNEIQSARVDKIMGAARTSWPWAVFMDSDDAVEWLKY